MIGYMVAPSVAYPGWKLCRIIGVGTSLSEQPAKWRISHPASIFYNFQGTDAEVRAKQ